MGYRTHTHRRHPGDFRRGRRGERIGKAVTELGSERRDLGPRGQGTITGIEVWRSENLGVALEIPHLIADAAHAAAGAQHPSVGEQHGDGVILTRSLLRCEHPPLAGRRVVEFGVVHVVCDVDETLRRVLETAGGEHRSVGQDGEIVLASLMDHRAGGRRCAGIQINDDGGAIEGTTTCDEDLPGRVVRKASVVAVLSVSARHRLVATGASSI